MTWLRGHPAAAAALVYLALSIALYAPALVPGHTLSGSDYLWSAAPWSPDRPDDVRVFGSNFELVDSAVQFQPWLQHTRDSLLHLPLWNTRVAAGRPFLANAQSAVLSPFSLPAYLLPFWWSLGVIGVLKVFTAAFGTYLLGRALRMRFGGALLAGVVYAFSLYFLVWVSWPHTNVWALLPWLLLLTDAVVRRPTPVRAAGLAAVVALQFFGGHPESNFHLLAATVCFFVLRVLVLRRAGELPGLRGPLLAFAGGLAGGAALAAITLLPFLELLYRSSDVDVREGFSEIALPRKYLLGLALPDYWGRGTHLAIDAYAQERALYVGALPLLLGIVAVAVRPSLERVGVALFAVLVAAIALGLPPFPDLAAQLPIIRTGNHLRVIVILMMCLALLAGWGLDELASRRLPRPWAIIGLGLAMLALPVLILAARSQLSAGLLGDAIKIAAGFDWPEPPRQRRRDHRDPDGIARHLARVHGAGGPARGRTADGPPGGDRLRRARRRARSGRPVQGGHGRDARDLHGPGHATLDPGDRVPPVEDAEPLRGARARLRALAADPQHGDALVALRRAQLRPPGREALRHPLAPRRAERRADGHPDHERAADRRGPAGVPAAERHRRDPGPGRPAREGPVAAGRLQPSRHARLREPGRHAARRRGRRAARRPRR